MDNPRVVGGKMAKMLLPSWMENKGVSWSFSLAGMP